MPVDKKTILTMLLIVLFFLLMGFVVWLVYSYQLHRLERQPFMLPPN